MNEPLTPATFVDLPFSNAVETDHCLYLSGQGGIDPITNAIVGPDIESQTIATMENIRAILNENNLDMEHIVKVNVYLSDRQFYERFNNAYRTFFKDAYPARTAIYCQLNYDLLVEIDAIAVKGEVKWKKE